jgi:adenylate cyclase
MPSLRARAAGVLDRVHPLVAEEADTERDRLRKSLFVVVNGVGIVITTLSALGSHLSGAPTPVSLSLWAYAALLVVTLTWYVATRRGLAAMIGLLLAGNVAVSWFGTWYQGGIAPSGANVLWAIVTPIVAMLVLGRRASIAWFLVFLAVLFAGIFVRRSDPPPVSEEAMLANFAFVLGGIALFLFLVFLYFTRERDRAQGEADMERARSDALLHNVLPDQIVTRLKDGERVIADRFDEASVLFADIAGFTPMSSTMAPDELVRLLNDVFSEFDALTGRFGVEKIKTIGDCYMVAAGVPVPRDDHASVIADMALEMQRLVAEHPVRGRDLRFRIGLNSGPLVAGVIGRQKFIYDLWGDTVNTASRMESHGMAGQIQITAATRGLLDGRYRVSPRGTVEVKGKGAMETFVLEGRDD